MVFLMLLLSIGPNEQRLKGYMRQEWVIVLRETAPLLSMWLCLVLQLLHIEVWALVMHTLPTLPGR